MSDFDDFVIDGFEDAAEIIGTVALTICGFAGTFTGVHDRTAKAHDREPGGFVNDAAAVLVCARSQFPMEPPTGRDCVADGVKYRIDRVESDVATYTLFLTLRVRKTRE
jgi:hypothetical protein